jgi:hypothetical protein
MDKLIPELRELDNIEFQTYFPELDLKSLLEETGGAINFQDPTEETINNLSEELNNRFEKGNNDVGYVEIMCPNCEQAHYLNKSDIQGLPVVENDRE